MAIILSLSMGLVVGIHRNRVAQGSKWNNITERVSHITLTTQRILTKCVRGVTFKGHDWRWAPTTNQDVNDSTRSAVAL
jgi:hypothetical protein